MLTDIHPYLTGDLLRHLDAMGHSDAVVLADANFPAERLASRVLTFPGLGTPELLAAVRTVVPLDDDPALDLMLSPDDDGAPLPVQEELIAAAGAGAGGVRFFGRDDFYERAAAAHVVVRTGETRIFGNVILRKGVVSPAGGR
ncbi:MAG TPA: transport protein RbsD/FucU [Streptomyces sp.]|nr:transport protein RbsD/FucU [Streptomyces sp.]